MSRRTLLAVTAVLGALALVASVTAVVVLPDVEPAAAPAPPAPAVAAAPPPPPLAPAPVEAPTVEDPTGPAGGVLVFEDGQDVDGDGVIDATEDLERTWLERLREAGVPEDELAELLDAMRRGAQEGPRDEPGAELPGAVRVRWEQAGVPGARVRLFAAEREGGPVLADLRTAVDGVATLPAALEGAGDLVALIEGEGVTVVPSFTPEWGLDVDLAEVATRVRTVTPADEPAPAHVRALWGAHVLAEGDSDAGGLLELRVGGLVRFEARAADGRVGRAALVERGGSVVNILMVVLRPGKSGDLAGTVVDATDQPVAQALVRATWPGGDGEAVAQTGADGAFRLAALPAGRVSVEVWRAGRAPGVAPDAAAGALVDPAREATVRLRAAGAGQLEVHVVDGAAPVSGAAVHVVDPAVTRYGDFEASGAQQSASTDEAGEVRLTVPPGRWNLRVNDPDGDRVAVAQAVVQAHVPARVVVDLGRQRTLTVRVRDPQGRPVRGVFMDASMPGLQWSDMPAARTDAAGVARFDALPPGLAELHLGLGDQWRMLRTSEDEAEFTWTQPAGLRLQGVLEDGVRDLRVVTVHADVAKLIAEAGDQDSRVTVVPEGDHALLDAEVLTPGGAQDVWLVPADLAVAPVRLGLVDAEPCELLDWRARFPRAGVVVGRLVDQDGAGVAGSVTVEGTLGGALAARAQWLSGTANDPWLTVNEWAVGTSPDGLFELAGLPPGRHTLLLSGVGCTPRGVEVTVDEGGRVDLGGLPLTGR